MHFHLDLDTGLSPSPLQHSDPVLLVGSCFTEHIGQKLKALKFDCHSNPFGIVFNPLSMEQALRRLIYKEHFGEPDLLEHRQSWLSLDTHSSLSSSSKDKLLQRLNARIEQWHQRLRQAGWLVLTFGSAFYYEHRASQRIVANCHKLPARDFNKRLASVQELTEAYNGMIGQLRHFNPGLRIILSVSPVKHLRDGIVENSRSKAALILAAHSIAETHSHCYYFPAYELVNDDLRDYRFYEADLAHPNQQAIDYVWDKFSGTYFDRTTQALLRQIADIQAAFQHRPLRSDSPAFADFKAAQLLKCEALLQQYPYLDLEAERSYFSS